MENKLTLGSLFDGSGGFPLGGILAGITPVWASEVEPFPLRVTEKRLPFMKQLGDISKINGGEIEPVDIITFGSPCQDMSIAGRRDGLEGARSSLFYQAIRIVKEMRGATDGKYPRYIVWENVTGAFSSNKGEDFRAVLEQVAKVKDETAAVPGHEKWTGAGEVVGDGFSIAWRVLDAQFWGVPQRRKRIYLVADFASQRAGRILFESEGVSGYSAEGFRAWQRTAGNFESGAGAAGVIFLNDQGGNVMEVSDDITGTLRAETHGHPPNVVQSAGFCTEHSAKSRSIGYGEETSPTLRAGVVPAALMFENHSQDARYNGPLERAQALTARYGTGGNNQPLVMETPKLLKIRSGKEGGGKGALIQDDLSATIATHNDQTLFQPKAYGICSKASHAMLSDNPHSGFYEAETTRTLDCNGGNPSCNQGGMAVVAVQSSMIGREDKNGPQGMGTGEDISFTLNTVDRHAVAYSASKATFFMNAQEELAATLVASDYKDPPVVNQPEYIVRRLTPIECARLQGFPDWWCDGLGNTDPDETEIDRWMQIFEMHRTALGKDTKPKSRNAVVKWLKEPYSDSAAYKMWGNGVALPCVFFVLSGIVYHSQLSA